MKLRCAILDDFQNIALKIADWSRIASRVDTVSYTSHFQDSEQLIKAIEDKEIVVIMRERTPFRRELFKHLPNLKLLVTSGPRNAAIDLEAATEHGVVVCGTESNKEPPMELTWGLLLSLARHIPQEHMALRTRGLWQSTIGTGLYRKQLGLLGLGKIGSLMVPVAKAFGMSVTAWSQNLTLAHAESLGVSLAESKEALLRNSDFVSIHLVLSDRTRHLLKANDLQQMRKSSYLINTSRAAIIQSEALVEALQNPWIAGAGLDVFEIEPLPMGDILRTLPNVITTPHLGYVTEENYQIFYRQAIDDIESYLNNKPKRLLNFEELEKKGKQGDDVSIKVDNNSKDIPIQSRARSRL